MISRPSVRARWLGIGAAVILLVAILGYHHYGRRAATPEPPANSFNPAAFNAPAAAPPAAAAPALDAPYVASDQEVVDAMLALARVRPDDDVVDLGSGDGRILIAAARSNGAHGLGIDIDPARIREANANARAAGVASLVDFRRQDLFQTPLADAEVVTLYLTQDVNLRLRQRLLDQMRPGTRVVSHDFDMADWHWDQRRRVGGATIYLWVIPARIGGSWTLSEGGRSVPLTIEQSYQSFTGTAGDGRVEQGHIDGTNVRFVANLGQGRQVFEGRADGDTIAPSAPGAAWRAVRAR